MEQPLWRVVEDPAYTISIYSGVIIVIMVVGAVVISALTRSLVLGVLVSIPPIMLAVIMLIARNIVRRTEVSLFINELVVRRNNEVIHVPIGRISEVVIHPVIFRGIGIRNFQVVPRGVLKLNTWSITFMEDGRPIVNVWVSEYDYERLRRVLNKLCATKALCIKMELKVTGNKRIEVK